VNKNIQDWNFKSADGRAIFGCLRKPEGDGPFPAVMFIHGGLGDNPEYTKALLDWSVAELLFLEGFAVFSTDYRLDHTGKDIGDIVAAFKSASAQPFVDEQKIAYFGDSHGAYLAIMAATQTDPFALIHGWGVADMAEWYAHIKTIPSPTYQRITGDLAKALGGTPEEVPDMYIRFSPRTQASYVTCPVLILHGEADKEVPVSHAHILAEAIRKTGGKHELKIFKNGGHGLRSPELRKTMDPIVLGFLKRSFEKDHQIAS
jgi:dipeptidyl aminopeptidase/acylaminoacyl peptidase